MLAPRVCYSTVLVGELSAKLTQPFYPIHFQRSQIGRVVLGLAHLGKSCHLSDDVTTGD